VEDINFKSKSGTARKQHSAKGGFVRDFKLPFFLQKRA
jgi:hypothetical protein